MIDVIKTYPLATLISVENNTPFITHLPLIFEDGKLVGHIDNNNPHTKLLANNNPVTVIFSGPDCYISPSLFTTPELPTWNYIKVHIQGKVTKINDPERVKQSMVTMTSILESPNQAYSLELNDPKMEQFINYVSGFTIEILNWEGKFKLSQNKSATAQHIAKTQLIEANKASIEPFLDLLS